MVLTKKHYIYAGLAIVILVIIIAVVKRMNAAKAAVAPVVSTPAAYSQASTDTFPLHAGSVGNNVKRLQTALNKNGGTLTVDGADGSKTTAELLKQTGKETISLDELVKLETDGPTVVSTTASGTVISAKADVEVLAVDVKTDIDKNYIVGRREEYPWTAVAALSNENLIYLADYYQRVYGVSLYKAVDDAYFNPVTSIDGKILNRLRALGKL